MDLDRVGRGRLDALGIGLADAAVLQARCGRGPAALLAVPHQIGGLADLPVLLGGGALRDDLGDGRGRRGAGGQGQGGGGRGERGQGDTVHTARLIISDGAVDKVALIRRNPGRSGAESRDPGV
ncbi:hypothetical protein D3C86_1610430 [compost metagenome]